MTWTPDALREMAQQAAMNPAVPTRQVSHVRLRGTISIDVDFLADVLAPLSLEEIKERVWRVVLYQEESQWLPAVKFSGLDVWRDEDVGAGTNVAGGVSGAGRPVEREPGEVIFGPVGQQPAAGADPFGVPTNWPWNAEPRLPEPGVDGDAGGDSPDRDGASGPASLAGRVDAIAEQLAALLGRPPVDGAVGPAGPDAQGPGHGAVPAAGDGAGGPVRAAAEPAAAKGRGARSKKSVIAEDSSQPWP